MKTYRILVGDTPTVLVPVDNINRPVWLDLEENFTIYVGNSNVTVAEGFPLRKLTQPLQGALGVGDGLWAITDHVGGIHVRVITADPD